MASRGTASTRIIATIILVIVVNLISQVLRGRILNHVAAGLSSGTLEKANRSLPEAKSPEKAVGAGFKPAPT